MRKGILEPDSPPNPFTIKEIVQLYDFMPELLNDEVIDNMIQIAETERRIKIGDRRLKNSFTQISSAVTWLLYRHRKEKLPDLYRAMKVLDVQTVSDIEAYCDQGYPNTYTVVCQIFWFEGQVQRARPRSVEEIDQITEVHLRFHDALREGKKEAVKPGDPEWEEAMRKAKQ